MINVTSENRWFAFARPNPQAKLRLFCFPYAGAGAVIYKDWSDGLPINIEVRPIQLPGRGGRLREPASRHLSPLLDDLSRALLPYLDKPFAFFGHSMGAILSFELARLLRRKYRKEPAHLFVSGRGAPQLNVKKKITYDLPEAEFIEQLVTLNGTPKELLTHPGVMRLMLPVLRADFEITQTHVYKPEPPLDCPLSAFGGLDDLEVPSENLNPWGEQTRNTFSLYMLPGDHFFLNQSRPLLLQIINQEIQKIVKPPPGPFSFHEKRQ